MKNMATSTIKSQIDIQVRRLNPSYPSAGINAGAQYHVNLKTLIDEDLPDGYECAGIVGFSTGAALAVLNCGYYASDYSYNVMNISSGKITPTAFLVYYLAIKK